MYIIYIGYMKYEFPELFLLTNKNKIRFWKIWVSSDNKIAKIHTKYGMKDGAVIQPSPQIIDKSIGNSTTFLRAKKLAATKWNNRIQKGYNQQEPKVKPSYKRYDIKQPIMPMKAYSIDNKNIEFPAFIQPKLDGYRALLHKNGNKYEFLSNTQRPYNHLEHLSEDLDKIKLLNNKDIYLDGELYLEDEHVNTLRSILSSIELTGEKSKITKKIKFYVFDMFDLKNMNMSYVDRYKVLQELFKIKFKNITLTPTSIIKNNNELDKYFEKYVKEGYEGIIVRNMRGLYKLRGKSIDVLKSKDVKKNKFIIVGYKEAKGNNKGTVVWEIRCNNDPRKSFWTKPMGSREERKMMFQKAESYIGKEVMVKYFEANKNGCVTKNPVAFFT